MKRIDHSQYLALVTGAKVLERDGYGEKVLALPDGAMVKIFRRKRWLSTALLFPYARRFVSNASRLAERKISTVSVITTAYCPAVSRHLVTYRPLPGITLRQALEVAGGDQPLLLAEFARFVATLHQKGVYFRSLHFGNIIVPPAGGQLGLIDVADMSFHRGPLPLSQRARNFRHMLRYREDRAALSEFGWTEFINGYLEAASMSPRETVEFLTRLRRIVEPFPTADERRTG